MQQSGFDSERTHFFESTTLTLTLALILALNLTLTPTLTLTLTLNLTLTLTGMTEQGLPPTDGFVSYQTCLADDFLSRAYHSCTLTGLCHIYGAGPPQSSSAISGSKPTLEPLLLPITLTLPVTLTLIITLTLILTQSYSYP